VLHQGRAWRAAHSHQTLAATLPADENPPCSRPDLSRVSRDLTLVLLQLSLHFGLRFLVGRLLDGLSLCSRGHDQIARAGVGLGECPRLGPVQSLGAGAGIERDFQRKARIDELGGDPLEQVADLDELRGGSRRLAAGRRAECCDHLLEEGALLRGAARAFVDVRKKPIAAQDLHVTGRKDPKGSGEDVDENGLRIRVTGEADVERSQLTRLPESIGMIETLGRSQRLNHLQEQVLCLVVPLLVTQQPRVEITCPVGVAMIIPENLAPELLQMFSIPFRAHPGYSGALRSELVASQRALGATPTKAQKV
jgi:hypothetical protein